MDVRAFWALIGEAGGRGRAVEKLLAARAPDEIVAFGEILQAYLSALHREDLWAAAYAIRGGMGDDSFDYFRGWLVGRGEAAVVSAVRDPEWLAEIAADVDPRDETMLGAARRAYEKKTGNEMPAGERVEIPTSDWPPDRVPHGADWSHDFYRRIYPKLFARFIEPHGEEKPNEATISHDRFWELIELARKALRTPEALGVSMVLAERFRTADLDEVVGFERWRAAYDKALFERRDMRAASIVLFESDDMDTFAGFRGWLLAQGRAVVSLALRDVDALGDAATDLPQPCEGMLLVTLNRLMCVTKGAPMDIADRDTWSGDWLEDPPDPRAKLPRLAAKADAEAAELPQDERDARALVLLAKASKAGDDRVAKSLLERAAKLEPQKGNILLELARVLLRLGDADGSLATLDQAIARVPTHADALFDRSQIHVSRGDRERAIADARAAAEHGSREAQKWIATASTPKRVRHKKFGEGAVVSIEQTWEGPKLEIDFPVGRKKLLASFIEIIE